MLHYLVCTIDQYTMYLHKIKHISGGERLKFITKLLTVIVTAWSNVQFVILG